jgi:hypothetical protein
VSDRRNRQAREKRVRESKAKAERSQSKLEEAKDNLEHTKYLADKAESRAESYLLRMRNGYAEGAKLFFDMFKTQATLTTGSILVIAALSEGLLAMNEAYRPLIWFSYVSLLFSMLASLRTMDIVTANVFTTLTSENRPQPVVPEDEDDARGREEEDISKAEALKKQSEGNLTTLQRRSRWASWSFYAGIGSFALFVVVPPLIDLTGVAPATIAVAVAAGATIVLYRRV